MNSQSQQSTRKQIAVIDSSYPGLPSPIFIKLQAPEISIWLGKAEGYTFDAEGRPYSGFRRQQRFRRALDGRMVITAWGEGPPHQRARLVTLLTQQRAAQELRLWRQRLTLLQTAIRTREHAARWLHADGDSPPAQPEIESILETVLDWDEDRLQHDIARFHSTYRPVSILPPDQYLALYIQATLGCSYNRCLFCEFYRDRPHLVRSHEQFVHHLDEVSEYFGAGLRMRRRLFLGDANALHMEPEALRKRFATLHDRFAISEGASAATGPAFDGIYSFIDSFTGVRLAPELLADLAAMHLRRVYLGFETGEESLRKLLHKPGSTTQVIDTVNNLKQAGIAAGVILLNGIGGGKFAARHRRDSIAALEKMALDRQDLIFLSDLVVSPESEYNEVAARNGWEIFTSKELLQQRQDFIAAVEQSTISPKVKIANYDVREFVY